MFERDKAIFHLRIVTNFLVFVTYTIIFSFHAIQKQSLLLKRIFELVS